MPVFLKGSVCNITLFEATREKETQRRTSNRLSGLTEFWMLFIENV